MTRLILTVMLVAVLAAPGCAPRSRQAQPEALKIRLMADPGTLDPQMSYNGAGAMLAPFSYDNLVLNDHGVIKPQLAKAWRIDGAKVTLFIRTDAICEDGALLTADTIARNVHRLIDPQTRTANAASIFGSTHVIVGTDTVANSVTLTLDKPYGDILYGLSRAPMICGAGLSDLNRLRRLTDGTGPFRLIESVPGDHYTFVRRPGYRWGLDGASTEQPGFPKRVVLKVVENDTTAANMLAKGELDIARIVGPDRGRLAPGDYIRRQVAPSLYSAFFNQHPGRPGESLIFRRALAAAIDRTMAARAAFGPGVRSADSFLAPDAPCFDVTNAAHIPPFDPSAAMTALRAAGFVRKNGVLTQNGRPVRFVVITPSDFALVADVLVEALSRLGLQPIVRTESEAQITEATFLGGDWDLVVDNTDPSITGRNVQFFTGAVPPAGLNFTYNRDPVYDDIVTVARGLTGGSACAGWQAANTRVLDRAVLVPLFFGVFHWFGRKVNYAPVFNEQSALETSTLRLRP